MVATLKSQLNTANDQAVRLVDASRVADGSLVL
jgi:hypothetical protein